MPSLHGLHAAISMLLEFEPEAIESHILAITESLRNTLAEINGLTVVTSYPDTERAGIVTVRLPERVDCKEVFKKIGGRNVFIALREGQLRFSPHFYSSPDEMLEAAQATRECLASAR